jgi:predicted Zn-dependent protease
MLKMKYKKKIKATALAAAFSLSIGACTLPAATAEAFDVGSAIGAVLTVGVQYAFAQKQINYINTKGRNEYMDQVKDQYGVNNDSEANQMLTDVMTRLSDSISVTDPTIKDKPYNYFVNNQKSFNAFCTLGHNLSVNIGLFDKLNYNEDEIAFVVAHELGHGEKNHPAKGVNRALPLELVTALYASQNDNTISYLGAVLANSIGTAKLVTKPMESEADALAFDYAVGASYNPGAGAAVWQRVLEKIDTSKDNVVTDLFNDHPTNIKRRDKYNAKVTAWSQGVVKVNKDTGMISLRDKDFIVPAETSTMSSKERAYLVAGNLSAVYHNNKRPVDEVWTNGNQLKVGAQYIMDLNNEPNPTAVTEKLKKIL